eukprot:12507613-Alexandrium_andersonii.AAC.1
MMRSSQGAADPRTPRLEPLARAHAAPFFGKFGTCSKKRRRTHPFGAPRTSLEAVSGSAQLKLRRPQAISSCL